MTDGVGHPETAAEYFGAMRESYDSLIRRAVPRYAEITAALVQAMPPTAESVLELGCGTGNLSMAIASRYPEARCTFVDASEEMIELTWARLAHVAPELAWRATFRTTRFEELELEPESVDLVTSAFSLHHVRDKDALFHRLRAALRPGGALCIADQLRGATHENHERAWNDWLAFCRLPGNCSEQEIEELVAHSRAHDHYASVSEHFRLLGEAGFASPDCVWRGGMWGVITASTS